MIYLAKANPGSDDIANLMGGMISYGDSAADTTDSLVKFISNMQGDAAQNVRMQIGDRILAGMEGKPLVIAAQTKDGAAFTTADWKGKVILVDFWATWCGPCREELPRVTKAYKDYHSQGLEVLGVSCDQDLPSLNAFLLQNPDMAWPQLFNPAHPGWHALATAYGINGIPTMFLIDKEGILRTVRARATLEIDIPKLLAEPGP
jgi:thiol-disulfide isomerase/thioredoxin